MLYEYLKEFVERKCSCGKSHNACIPQISIKNGAIDDLPAFINKNGYKKAFILSDVKSYRAVGDKVCNILNRENIRFTKYTIIDECVKPDEKTVGNAMLHFDKDCDVVVAIGSGVINDTGKVISSIAKLPYVIVATAPSMDGYASTTSSMDVDGLKVSLPTKSADLIIGDLEVLKNAPLNMLSAGLGDMLAKYISIAEWRIAHEVVGEYYCEEIANLVRVALKKCIDNAEGLLERNEFAVKAVFEGLVLCGIAMSFAGLSRPASGVEHYFSHVWDMRGLEFGTKTNFHGTQCAVATFIVAGLYEKVLTIIPDKNKAVDYVSHFNFSAWADELSSFIGSAASVMISNENVDGKYDVDKHSKRINVIISKWDKIREIIREEIPSKQEIAKILKAIKISENPKEIGIDCDLFTTLLATKDIRDKYVLSRLLWDLGVIEEVKSWL